MARSFPVICPLTAVACRHGSPFVWHESSVFTFCFSLSSKLTFFTSTDTLTKFTPFFSFTLLSLCIYVDIFFIIAHWHSKISYLIGLFSARSGR